MRKQSAPSFFLLLLLPEKMERELTKRSKTQDMSIPKLISIPTRHVGYDKVGSARRPMHRAINAKLVMEKRDGDGKLFESQSQLPCTVPVELFSTHFGASVRFEQLGVDVAVGNLIFGERCSEVLEGNKGWLALVWLKIATVYDEVLQKRTGQISLTSFPSSR